MPGTEVVLCCYQARGSMEREEEEGGWGNAVSGRQVLLCAAISAHALSVESRREARRTGRRGGRNLRLRTTDMSHRCACYFYIAMPLLMLTIMRRVGTRRCVRTVAKTAVPEPHAVLHAAARERTGGRETPDFESTAFPDPTLLLCHQPGVSGPLPFLHNTILAPAIKPDIHTHRRATIVSDRVATRLLASCRAARFGQRIRLDALPSAPPPAEGWELFTAQVPATCLRASYAISGTDLR
eukprot:1980770-Rhodomonas_salina.1